MLPRKNTALVIVGHGSTLNPDSSIPTHAHADTIRQMGIFDEVVCAFWKEEPGMREVLRTVDSPEVYVVPNFISEGYFTQDVIPRELGLSGKTTELLRQRVHYCAPVGIHPSMTRLLLKRADEVAPGIPREESSLVIVGHGTGFNENSTKAIKDQVALIREMNCGFREVLDAYMEEPPLVADWVSLTTAPNVIVVPFFIADGLHSYQDIPVLLGIEKEPTAAASQVGVFRRNPFNLHGRQLFFSSSIGTEALMAEVILDQVAAFDAENSPAALRAPAKLGLPEMLQQWLAGGTGRIGQVTVQQTDCGFLLRHHGEEAAENLAEYHEAEDAREIARYDDAGEFRPLKTAPTLKRGWQLNVPDIAALQLALEFLYPSAVANWLRYSTGEAKAPALRETLGYQTGIYRVTGLIRDPEAAQLTADVCGAGCQRRVLWDLNGIGPWNTLPPERQTADAPAREIPLLCINPCQILVGGARTVVKKRMKAEADASAHQNAEG